MPTDPNILLESAQKWITVIGTIAALVSTLAIALATLVVQTRKKLHVVLRGVEDAGAAAKAAVANRESEANVVLDDDILKATGKPTKKLKRGKLNLGIVLLGFLCACGRVDLRPTVREARITIEHFREDYARVRDGGAFVSSRVAAARVSEADAAIMNLKAGEETK